MRIVFMGTPDFAVESLKALTELPHEIVGVFTQPDRPVGRGHKIEKTPVKLYAEENGIPVFQFEKIRRQEGLDALRALKPDLCVTAAFGQILSKKILEVPRLGTINVHASLLPRHRGAAPVNRAIMQGDSETGVTTMLTDAGLDTGCILLKKTADIKPDETAGELTERLAKLGAALLKETVQEYAAGNIVPIPQNEAEATYEPMMDKSEGLIDWNKTAPEIHNLVRGVDPWPGAYTYLNGEVLKVWKSACFDMESACRPGSVVKASGKDGLSVACGQGKLEILELQLPGGKRMSAKAYLAGRKIEIGTVLGEHNG